MRGSAGILGVFCFATLTACGSSDPGAADQAPEGTSGAAGNSSGGSSATSSDAGGGSGAAGGVASGNGGNHTNGGAAGTSMGSGGTTTGTGGSNSGAAGAAMSGSDAGGSSGPPGAWVNVTPQALAGAYINTIVADPVRRSDLYIHVDHQGTWKSADYGLTWTKVSVGAMAMGTGAWSAAIDRNPNRDPATPPTMYIPQGYGALGIWKSIDGGVNWTSAWNNNVFAPDGTTNISSDVGGDIAEVLMVDPSDARHVITCLHGYGGTGGNNGVFETTDGGQKWLVHKATTFTFQPHNSLLSAIDAKIWMVTPGTVSPTMNMYRTTDGGGTWSDLGNAPQRGMGHILARAGTTLYTGADYNSGVAKSTDMGLTWKQIANTGGQVSWVVATPTKVYASDAYQGTPTIRHADLANDAAWSSDNPPSSMNANGSFAVPIFDGVHHVIVAAQHTAGVWRYVEP